MKFCRQKVIWIGVYHTVVFLGKPGRILEAVLPNRTEAETWLQNTLDTHMLWDKKDFHLEEVDVTMHAWEY